MEHRRPSGKDNTKMEKVILVGHQLKKRIQPEAVSLDELERLADTAGAQTVKTYFIKLAKYVPSTLIGSGKASEIAQVAQEENVSTVIFDEELSPAQQRNLEKIIPSKVIDRTRLILDIFAQRANTREGELQVELAQSVYMLPRLSGAGISMMQQKGGIGTRGPGERKLEYDRRRIRDKIVRLKKEIDTIRQERQLRRKRRETIPLARIAIVGYTNAGKSTLLNTLATRSTSLRAGSVEKVYTDDKLFATLDPTTRKVKLGSGARILFTDTVGFIQKLPHTLVAAFRATLEEIALTDCILHVQDISSDLIDVHRKTVTETLKELDADKIPSMEVFNKTDLISAYKLQKFKKLYPSAVFISALDKKGIASLLKKVQKVLLKKFKSRKLTLDYQNYALISKEIYSSCMVTKLTHRKNGKTEINFMATDGRWNKILSEMQ